MQAVDFILPILGLGLIVNTLLATKGAYKWNHWVELVLGIFIMGFSIWASIQNSDAIEKITSQNDVLHSKVTHLDSVLDTQTGLIKSIGLKIDRNTGKVSIVDTQVLKNILENSTSENKVSNEGKRKFNDAVNNLKSSNYDEKDMSLNYIISNFPDRLTEEQIKIITSEYEFLQGHVNAYNQINLLLSRQQKSLLLVAYYKQVLIKNEEDRTAWHYLFRKDVSIDMPYVVDKIKNKPNHCMKYANITQYAIESKNTKICMSLLNSHDLVDFLVSNKNEQKYLVQAIEWLNKIINSNPSYETYRDTYFFEINKH